MLGTDPALGHWGSKAGSRELFARCVPHPPGSDLAHNLEDLSEVAATLWEEHPKLKRCVIKLNEGISGEGNAASTCCHWASRRSQQPAVASGQELEHLPMPPKASPCREQGLWWRPGWRAINSSRAFKAPFTPVGVEVLSTHEQILGGANGQTYQGCRFPADQAYRLDLMRHGQAVGEALAAEGA